MKSIKIENDLHAIMKQRLDDTGIPIQRQVDDILRSALITNKDGDQK